MIKLYQRDNLYSTSKTKDSTQIDLPATSYVGCKLNFDSHHRPEIITLCGKIFRLNDENLNLLIRSSKIFDGKIHQSLSWQLYKRKMFILPDKLLDIEPPKFGDIVKPILEKSFHSSRMIYLGKRSLVKYNQHGKKTVYKDQHLFVGLDERYHNMIITYPKIDSAFIKISHDMELADEIIDKINFGSGVTYYGFEDHSLRIFYLEDFRNTKIVPKMVKIDNIPTKSPNRFAYYNNAESSPALILDDGNEKYITTIESVPLIKLGYARGHRIDDLEILDLDEESISSHIILHPYKNKKHVMKEIIDIPPKQTYQYYMVVYELYQNGILVGRK